MGVMVFMAITPFYFEVFPFWVVYVFFNLEMLVFIFGGLFLVASLHYLYAPVGKNYV